MRTSVEYGTALDIAGKGIANCQSLVEAMEMTVNLVERKMLFKS